MKVTSHLKWLILRFNVHWRNIQKIRPFYKSTSVKKVKNFQQTSIYSPNLSVSNLFSTVWESHLYKGTFFWGMFFQLNAFCLTSRNNNMFNCLKFDYIVYRLIIPKQNIAKQDMTIETPVWLWYMSFPAKAVLRCKKFWIYFDWSTRHKQNVQKTTKCLMLCVLFYTFITESIKAL